MIGVSADFYLISSQFSYNKEKKTPSRPRQNLDIQNQVQPIGLKQFNFKIVAAANQHA